MSRRSFLNQITRCLAIVALATTFQNSFAEEKGPDALKEIFQSYDVSRFSELPKNKWLEVLKLMEQQEPEDEFSSDDIQEEIK